MARALSTPPNGNTANTRPHRLIIRHECKGRHLCVVHEYGGERLEGAALEPSLKAMEASIGRLIETSHSRETGTLRQATPEQEGQSTDAKRKERNQKRRERRKNLRAKKLEERNDAENEGTQSQAPQLKGPAQNHPTLSYGLTNWRSGRARRTRKLNRKHHNLKGPAQHHPKLTSPARRIHRRFVLFGRTSRKGALAKPASGHE